MIQELGIGEMLQARGVVSHDVFHPVDEGDLGAVAVVSLVETGQLAEVGHRAFSGSAAFGVTGQCWGVVGEVRQRCASDVVGVGDVVHLGQVGGLL